MDFPNLSADEMVAGETIDMPATVEAFDDLPNLDDLPAMDDLPELDDLPGLSGDGSTPEIITPESLEQDMALTPDPTDEPLADLPDLDNLPDLADLPELSDLPELDDLPDLNTA
jgi:hypothetical protein